MASKKESNKQNLPKDSKEEETPKTPHGGGNKYHNFILGKGFVVQRSTPILKKQNKSKKTK